MSAQGQRLAATDRDAMAQAADRVKSWGRSLGFAQVGITDTQLGEHPKRLRAWLAAGHHADMDWMARSAEMRAQPETLWPGTLRVIACRMDCLPGGADAAETLSRPERGYIARYALGRDYHRVLRRRLAKLARRLGALAGGRHRALVDSAPVLERALAAKAGLGWSGKNTMLINRQGGSWFMLGAIYTDLPLPIDDAPVTEHCGDCRACLDVCPTGALVGPRQLDARRCISYLTIENKGPIPEPLRAAVGNRIFGCDDCQLACPWNRFAQRSELPDFQPRHGLDAPALTELAHWSEAEFLRRTEGSALRRAGYDGWRRNLAVALGNAADGPATRSALRALARSRVGMVAEHARWGLARHAGQRRERSPGTAANGASGPRALAAYNANPVHGRSPSGSPPPTDSALC